MQVEALKRELTEENRCILRDRLAEKGQAPAPPAPVNKTREVDYVGFANLPNQVYRRAVKKGFEFTLMVVGESGLGKSTLINSMFLADIYSPEYPGPSHRIKKTVQVSAARNQSPSQRVYDGKRCRRKCGWLTLRLNPIGGAVWIRCVCLLRLCLPPDPL